MRLRLQKRVIVSPDAPGEPVVATFDEGETAADIVARLRPTLGEFTLYTNEAEAREWRRRRGLRE